MTTQMSGERSQLAALPLEDKVALLTGVDSWRIPGYDALGLRPMITSDGPSGVRGTARIAVAYVTGVQSAGVAATVKHYVGNDSETERWTYDARIAERVLRELYLVPFEACVREAGTALVMAAYNVVNGSRMTE